MNGTDVFVPSQHYTGDSIFDISEGIAGRFSKSCEREQIVPVSGQSKTLLREFGLQLLALAIAA